MKKLLLLVGLLTIALAAAGVQSAAAATPTLTGFAPASGPPAWSVTLTGSDFTGSTAVTFTPVDPSYSPKTASFTVRSDTTIVATVPFMAARPLAATLTVDTPDGAVTSAADFTVDGRVALSEHRGSSGETIRLTGSGFTGATLVAFGTWRQPVVGDEPFALADPVSARFHVLGDTGVAAAVPALQSGTQYWVEVVSPAGTSVSTHSWPLSVAKPRLMREGDAFAIRPATVVPSGDGAFLMGKLYSTGRGRPIRWQYWGSSKAHGTGLVWIDNGIPNEAQGTFYGYPGTISADRVRSARFTRMTIRWRKAGGSHSLTLKLKRVASHWYWQ